MSVENAANHSDTPLPKRRWRVLRWVGGILVVLLLGALGIAAYIAHNMEPILRTRVVDSLSVRFQSPVELDGLHISLLDGLNVSGSGLKVQKIAGPGQPDLQQDLPPLVTVDSFSFHMGLWDLLHKTFHVNVVHIKGLRLSLPPKGQRPSIKQANQGKKISIYMDKIVCEDTVLTLGTDKPGKVPLEFDISHLTLTHIVPDQPMQFEATLRNPKPVGEIASNGSFGPWQTEAPGETPVSGSYIFSHADLGTIKGIGGILSSTGSYSGVLNAIVVDGQTETPDFHLDISEHPVPLQTTFHAIVDGTNGNVQLTAVEARLLQSKFSVTGIVERAVDASGHKISGHDIELNMTMPRGRIEDMLRLAVKSETPLMTGVLKMNAHIHIPPGEVRILKKITLSGHFDLSDAMYSNEKVQDKVDMLSLRAQGLPKEANPEGEAANRVAGELSSNFNAANGVIHLTQLDYEMPGTQVLLAGDYSMESSSFDFHGLLRTKAKVSQMTTGVKSKLLRLADPFFSKHGAGAEVPVKIGGTKTDLHFGLDFHDKDKNQNLAPEIPLW